MAYWASADERKVLWTQVLERDGYNCQLCGQAIMPGDWEPDHIIPRSKGGSDVLENLRSAHKSCNRSRNNGDRYSPLLYARRMGIENMTKDLLSKTARMALQALVDGWQMSSWGNEAFTLWTYKTGEYVVKGMSPHTGQWLLRKEYIRQVSHDSTRHPPDHYVVTVAGVQALARDKEAQAFRAACKGGGL